MNAPALNFDHWALPIRDVEASYDFYTKVLELPLLQSFTGDDWGGKPWLMMIFGISDGRQIALCRLRGTSPSATDGLPSDIRHFAFAVPSQSELSTWKKRLRANKVKFSEEDHGTQQSIYFQDPNGIVLEITTPTSKQCEEIDPSARDVVKQWIKDERS